MGGEPYFYFVKYQPDVQKALDELRDREFRAGRYNPVMMFIEFPVDEDSPAPGPEHATIAEALEDSDADGTRSILDISMVGDESEFCTACRLSDETLKNIYGTAKPTREMIEQDMSILDDIDRGHAIYTIVYRDGKPHEIFFAGYSFD